MNYKKNDDMNNQKNDKEKDAVASAVDAIVMQRGKTEKETLELNGWGVGDILEGDEGYGPDRIKITAIGEERFLCMWDYNCTGEFERESGNTTLRCRNWVKVA